METLSYLTDVIGLEADRVAGVEAGQRVDPRQARRLVGLENAHLESWGPFGRGWTLSSGSTAQVIEPQCIPLIAYPKAWSPASTARSRWRSVYFDAKTDDGVRPVQGQAQGAPRSCTEAPPPV